MRRALTAALRCIVFLLTVMAFATGTVRAAPSPVTIQLNVIPPVTATAGGFISYAITIANQGATPVALSGLNLTAPFPAGVSPYPGLDNPFTNCGAGTVSDAGSALTLTNGSLAAGASCLLTVNVVSATPGGRTFSVAAGAASSNEGVTNTAGASQSIFVAPALVLTNAFTPSLIMPAQSSIYSITIANTDPASFDIGFLGFFHPLPPGLTFATPANLTTTCGSANTIGASLLHLAGSLLAGTTCTISVSVHGAAGTYTDTFSAGSLSATGGNTIVDSNARLTIANPSGVTVAPAFSAPSIVAGGTSRFAIAIANTGATPFPLSSLALNNTLPAGVTLAPAPNAATSCGGAVTAVAGGTTFALGSGATLGAGSTCTVSVLVTAPAAGSFTDTVNASAVTDTEGATNAAAAGATLTVITPSPVMVSAAFAPATIIAGTSSVLSFTLTNTGPNATALSALALTAALPGGVAIAAVPALTNSCGGTAAAVSGGSTLTLTGANLGAGAACSLAAAVAAPSAGTFTTTFAAGSVTTTQGVTNAALASSALTVTTPTPVTLAKLFSPAAILATSTSVLSVTIANTGGNALALSALALSDTLPAGVAFAATPNASTTCIGGSASASGSTLSVGGGATLAAGATCTFAATVTSVAAGVYNDATGSGAVTTSQGVTNAAGTAATLTVTVPTALTVTSAFAPASILAGQTSTLTISVANAGASAIALSALGITQTLPPGVRVAAAPNTTTTCAGGILTAASGAAAFALSGATLAAAAGCTIAVDVLGSTTGTFVAATPAGALSTAQSISNPAAAAATLIVSAAPPVVLTPVFVPAQVALGQMSALTVTIANTAGGAVALSNLMLAIALPAGSTLSATPGAATSCGGTLVAAAGSATVTLGGGALSAGGTCTVAVTVTAIANGVAVLAIPPNGVTTAQNATNVTAAQATLTVASPALTVTNVANVNGSTVSAGQPIVYTVVITNAGSSPETNATLGTTFANEALLAGSVTLNGNAVSDAVVIGSQPFGTLAPGANATIVYTATVNPTLASGAPVTNRASAGGDQACTSPSCTATAAPLGVQAPVLSALLNVDGKMDENVVLGQIVTFNATIANTGATPAEAVTFVDALPAGVTPLSGSVTTAGTAARRVPSVVTVNAQMVAAAVGAIPPGTTAAIVFTARITAPPTGAGTDSATIAALGLASTVASNTVTLHSVPSALVVTKTANSAVARVGDRIDYQIGISTTFGVAFGPTTIVDRLPAGLSYAPGTARVNGALLEPAISGLTLTWTIPGAATAVVLRYATSTGATSAAGNLINTVSASGTVAGGVAVTGSGSASVMLLASTFGSCYPITGRVYADVRQSGHFEPGDRGLSGVRIDLDDGEAVITDAQGRYNFPCVRQGMHALRLDERSLPAKTAAFQDHAIDSERSTRRLVHHTFDDTIVVDVNFAVDVRDR